MSIFRLNKSVGPKRITANYEQGIYLDSTSDTGSTSNYSGYRAHKYDSSSTVKLQVKRQYNRSAVIGVTTNRSTNLDYLVVGGGNGGSPSYGPGGAGGSYPTGTLVLVEGDYTLSVTTGSGGPAGTSGNPSIISQIIGTSATPLANTAPGGGAGNGGNYPSGQGGAGLSNSLATGSVDYYGGGGGGGGTAPQVYTYCPRPDCYFGYAQQVTPGSGPGAAGNPRCGSGGYYGSGSGSATNGYGGGGGGGGGGYSGASGASGTFVIRYSTTNGQ